GSTTTPLPITDSFPLRTTPEGSSDSLYVTPLMTSVWPALCPPWKRTTMSARSESQSTILPLPSSPHWAPMTTTFAMTVLTLGCHKANNFRHEKRAQPFGGSALFGVYSRHSARSKVRFAPADNFTVARVEFIQASEVALWL